MNHRLLTLEQKAQNRRDRQKRNRTARRERRRAAIFETLPLPQYVVLLAAGELNAKDVFDLHYGDLRGSKHLVRKVWRETELMYEGTPTLPVVEDSELKDVERPRRRLDEANIASLAFEGQFEGGRQAYAVVAEQDGVAIARGDWAFFEHENLQNLLPGLHIPVRLCRREYLVNLHTDEGDNPVCLDFHSIDYTPLIRCEVRPTPSVNPRWRRRPREFPDDVRDIEQERREFEALWRSIKSPSSA